MARWEAVSTGFDPGSLFQGVKESTELHKVRPAVRPFRYNTPGAPPLERPRRIYG